MLQWAACKLIFWSFTYFLDSYAQIVFELTDCKKHGFSVSCKNNVLSTGRHKIFLNLEIPLAARIQKLVDNFKMNLIQGNYTILLFFYKNVFATLFVLIKVEESISEYLIKFLLLGSNIFLSSFWHSMTRFGEISPLLQKFTSILQIFDSLFLIW